MKKKGLGPYAEAAGISMVDLKSHKLNHVEHEHQKKGLVYELECYRRANGLPCRIIHCWCMNMFNVTAERLCANSAISSWRRLYDKITDIKACHKTGLDDLLTSFYHPPLSTAMLQIECTCTDSYGDIKTTNICSFVQDVINDIITDSVELCKRAQILETNREINSKELHCRTNNEQQNEIDKLKIKVRDLTDIRKKQIKKASERQCAFKQEIKKLKEKFKPRNVRRREKSKLKQICKLKNVQNEFKSIISQKDKQINEQLSCTTIAEGRYLRANEESTNLRKQKINLQKRVSKMKKKIEDLNSKSKVADLKQHISFLENEQCSQQDTFEDFMEKNPQICTFKGGVYTNEIRHLYMELLSKNVSINNCESVIRSVLYHLAGIDIGRLPQKATAASLMVESETLAKMQGGLSILQCENNTLQIDGTRKAFNEYATHNVTTGDGQSLSLGISDMSTGEAKSYFDCTKKSHV